MLIEELLWSHDTMTDNLLPFSKAFYCQIKSAVKKSFGLKEEELNFWVFVTCKPKYECENMLRKLIWDDF